MKTKKILIAYDSETITELLKQFLSEDGWQIDTTKDGIDALKKIFRDQPDCLIVSTDLPVINGFDLCHVIKSIEETKNTAVIISSSSQENDARFWAETTKSDAFYVPS